MKKIILLLTILLLTGCYNYNELNTLGIISSMYIDYKNEKYIINIEVDKNNKLEIFKSEGDSISTTLNMLEEKTQNKVYYAHLNAVFISEDVNKSEVISYFLRNPNINTTFYLVISDILPYDGNNMGTYAKKTLSEYQFYKFTDITQDFMNKNKDIILPKLNDDLTINEFIAYDSYLNNIPINLDEYYLYQILNSETSSSFKIPCHDQYFVLKTNKVDTNISIDDNINIYSDMELAIDEFTCDMDTTKFNSIEKLENITNDYFEKKINIFMDKLRKHNTDILGINNLIYNKYHNLNSTFLSTNQKVQIKSHINKKGLVLK